MRLHDIVIHEADAVRIDAVLAAVSRRLEQRGGPADRPQRSTPGRGRRARTLDTGSIGALAAGAFSATAALARLLGESEFSVLFHEGVSESMHVSTVDDHTILLAIFDERTTVGMVRLFAREASTSIGGYPRGDAQAAEAGGGAGRAPDRRGDAARERPSHRLSRGRRPRRSASSGPPPASSRAWWRPTGRRAGSRDLREVYARLGDEARLRQTLERLSRATGDPLPPAAPVPSAPPPPPPPPPSPPQPARVVAAPAVARCHRPTSRPLPRRGPFRSPRLNR